MEMNHLQDLMIEQLQDLYNAEGQLVKALPRMARAASSPQLKEAFQLHLEQTRGQVQRLERVFETLGQKARGRKCHAMQGLLEEGKELMEEDASPEVLDAGLIGAAQKVEHYEIAGYGTVRTYAQLLGNEEAARLLQQTLDEEGATDQKLTQLAESVINAQAAGPGATATTPAMSAAEEAGRPQRRARRGRRSSPARRPGTAARKATGRRRA